MLTSPPPNYTPGIIPLLRKALLKSHSQGTTSRAVLCYEKAVHVHVSRTLDVKWGCGYRNFIMACSVLMEQTLQPGYASLLVDPISPGVHNLQVWIEAAWKDGFDEEGASDLNNLVGAKKWIGTADLWVAFTYRGIPAELVDFDLKNQSQGIDIVLNWIVNYFTPKGSPSNINDALRGASAITSTDCMPIILQHNGHSRIIVGYEVSKSKKVTLLTFDPSSVVSKEMRNAAIDSCFQSASSSTKQSNVHNRKRPPASPPSTSPSTKRARSASVIHIDQEGVEVLACGPLNSHLPGERRQQTCENAEINPSLDGVLSHRKVLDCFRLKKLKKKQYQILYFPMTEPLNALARARKKTVTSTKIC